MQSPSLSIWLLVLCTCMNSTWATPRPRMITRAGDATNSVLVNSVDQYCLIVPKDPHTDIGDSEYPGGTTTYCSPTAQTSPDQGIIPDGFWRNVSFTSGDGEGRFVQLTGCINPTIFDRLNAGDAGGQYDSSGGSTGSGNPMNSVCVGYNHYVELLEPAGPRGCIRCCDHPADCPTHQDKMGCPNVIPGEYFDCDLS